MSWQDQPRAPKGTPEGGQWVDDLKSNLMMMRDKFGASNEGLVLKYGRSYEPAAHDYPMETVKQCYKNAFLLVEANPELTYVEGYAFSGVIPGLAIHHAWAVDEAGRVVDVTWKDGIAYFGIAFNQDYIRTLMIEKGTYGVLTHDTEMFREAIRSGTIPEEALK